ncbi:MAG: DUF1552 domain-containing protein [Planctomycetales bacterium]|nr:DUF1552 domain-containing protein [Planctomycetales bacterium]
MPTPRPISRRTLLRASGAAVALPFLEAMAPRTARAADGEASIPTRIAFFYVPNGVHMPAWRPEGEELAELPPTLKSLEPVKDRVVVVSNTAAAHCKGRGGSHEPTGGGYLIGDKCKHSEVPEVANASVDQVAAREVGLDSPAPSLTLGIDPGSRGDHGYSGTYMSNISWRSRSTPSTLELNPKQLYDRLFRGQQVSQPDWSKRQEKKQQQPDSPAASVLDLVRDQVKDLQRGLGYSDQQRLQEYLEGLRNVERRVAQANSDGEGHHAAGLGDDPLANHDDPRLPKLIIPDGRGIPPTYSDHVNLMLDILTLAFQTDQTRIATFMFSYEKSGRAYKEIDVSGSHHGMSHHQQDPEKHAALTRINTLHMELFARMLQRMADIREGSGTLLDHVMISYGSGISDGNRHNNDDLPLLVAGGGGGRVRGGRHVKLEQKTPICNLWLEMLAAAGVERSQFGDSTAKLSLS